MANETPESMLLSVAAKKELSRCIICQKIQDNNGSKKLTSTEKGRKCIISCSEHLEDDLMHGLLEIEYNDIKYHVNTCYPRYIRCRERSESKIESATDEISIQSTPCSSKDPEVRAKRRKIVQSPTLPHEKPCVICNQIKFKGESKRLRISEKRRANLFLSAIKFNKDDVQTRCILHNTAGDIFAADVMYHKKCLSTYLVNFQREVERIMNDKNENHQGTAFENVFQNLIKMFDMKNHAYSMSDCRDLLNEMLEKEGLCGKYIFYLSSIYMNVTH